MRRAFLLGVLLLGMSRPAWAALPVTATWELNASADAGNINGGGFNYNGANFATDLACTSANAASPVCTSASYNFVAGDVGHWLYIKSGTNWTATIFCQIASVAANAATLTAGAGTCNVIDTTQGSPAPRWTTNSSAGVASVASPTSGTWGVDYSRSKSKVQSTTTATNTVGVITVGGLSYGVNWVHNIVQIVAGTGATQGWYEITNDVIGTSFTLDRDPGGTTNISINLGGAIPLGSSTANRTDDAFFELGSATNGTGAMRFFIKSGSYSNQTINIAAAGGTQAPIVIEGYNSTRGDAPTGANLPALNTTSASLTIGANWDMYYLQITGTGASTLTMGSSSKLVGCKITNTSTSANRSAVSGSANAYVFKNELISYRGRGYITNGGGNMTLTANYFHDSDIGFFESGTGQGVTTLMFNVIESNVTAAVNITGTTTTQVSLENNTLYGGENKTGTGVLIATGNTNTRLKNNIIYGFVTGVSHADVQTVGYDDYNDYNNNTTDVSNWKKGSSDQSVNPTFASLAQVTGTTATYAGTTLTDTAANFSNVVDNQDFIYLISGTGLTAAGQYLITSHTNTTLVTSPDAGESGASNWTYQITTGRNFAIGTNLKAVGFPGAFPASLSTGYQDIGAVQRQESGSSACGF